MLYHKETNAQVVKHEVQTSRNWDAYEAAIDLGLIEDVYEAVEDVPDGIAVWSFEDDMTLKWFDNEADAIAEFEAVVNCYESALESEREYEQSLLESEDEYFVLSKTLWEGDEWTPFYSTDDKADADAYAARFSNNGVYNGRQDLKRVVNTVVVTKHQLVNEYSIKMSDAIEMVAYHHEATQLAMWDSEPGNVTVYMPRGIKSKAEYLAKRLDIKDMRGNYSVSGLIAKLINDKVGEKV